MNKEDSRSGPLASCMEMNLSELLGRKVEMRTPHDLSRYFRDEVLREAEMLYKTTGGVIYNVPHNI